MKRMFAIGIVVFTLLAAAAVSLWLLRSSPKANITNIAPHSVSVSLETNVGETYPVGPIASGATANISISGQDKLLWAVARFPDGSSKQSERIYVSSQGIVSVTIDAVAVRISYAL